jgi:HMG (high mobility group) box
LSFGRLSPSSLIDLFLAVMTGPVRTPPRNRAPGGQPPRPPNAWILYRSDRVRQMPPPLPGQLRTQADVSKAISEQWRNESEATRSEYERRAELKKAEHHAQFPDYRFQPKSKEQKERQRLEKKQEKERRPKRTRAQISAPPVAQVTTGSTSRQPLPHVAFTSSYNPSYYAETRFGPSGPSPPLSAAASPSEDISCLELQGDELQMPPPTLVSSCTNKSRALSPLTMPPGYATPTPNHPSFSKTPPHPDPKQWTQLVDAPSSSSSDAMTSPFSLWDAYSIPQTLSNDLTASVCCLEFLSLHLAHAITGFCFL